MRFPASTLDAFRVWGLLAKVFCYGVEKSAPYTYNNLVKFCARKARSRGAEIYCGLSWMWKSNEVADQSLPVKSMVAA
jgi:hypothetical protein